MAPKKAKKTKAEIEAEKLAREEEERKESLILEKRLADEAEKRRIEDLRIKEERRVSRVAELERFSIEYSSILDRLKDKEIEKAAEEKLGIALEEWAKYSDPTDDYDARSEKDMNTFLSMMAEMTVEGYTDALDLVKKIEMVSQNMEAVLSLAIGNNDSKSIKMSQNYLIEFSAMCFSKIDAATVAALRLVDANLNEKDEFQVEESANNVSVGVWASLAVMRPIRKALDFGKIGIKIELPKQILAQDAKLTHRIVRSPMDIYSIATGNESKTPLFHVVGDIYSYDIVIAPPPALSIRAKKWTIRDNSSSTSKIRKLATYPSSVASKCNLKVPDHLVMSDDIKIALWNNELKDWTEDGITEFQYTESNRTAQFYLTTIGIIALIKSRSIELPYKKWSLRPIFNHSDKDKMGKSLKERIARFTLVTIKHTIVIDIVGGICKLIKVGESRCFDDLIDLELSPAQLLMKLQRRGVNICPNYSDAAKLSSNVPKNADLEEDVLTAISQCVSSLEFESTKWNKELNDHQIGISCRETTIYTGGNENYDYECVLAEADCSSESFLHSPDVGIAPGASGVKYLLVMGNEYGGKGAVYSKVARPSEISHVNFSETLTRRLSGDALRRIERSNAKFSLAVFTLLKLVKPFSF